MQNKLNQEVDSEFPANENSLYNHNIPDKNDNSLVPHENSQYTEGGLKRQPHIIFSGVAMPVLSL